MLGELCQAGQGLPRDLAAAARWFTTSAQQGGTAAQYDLGYMYEQGQGVRHDEKLAAHWYQLAAEGGDALAQFDYGQRCILGLGVSQDSIEGLKWLLLAGGQGQADARAKAKSLQRELGEAQIAEAKRRVAAFTLRPAANKN
jgi:TPR repeat protein